MRTQIVVEGNPLEQFGAISQIEDTSTWRIGDYSGTTEIKCSWSAPVRFAAPWLRPGALVKVVEHGVTTRIGRLSEATPGEPWTVVAKGRGESLKDIPVEANGNVSDAGTEAGKSTSVYFSDGLTTYAPPVGWSRTWIVRPSLVSLGTDLSNYVSRVTPRYIPTGSTTAIIGTPVVDAVLEARYGLSNKTVDATALGPISAAQAQTLATERLDAGGRRLGWTGEIVLTDGAFLSGVGSPGRAMSPRAGDVFLVPGFTDPRSQAYYSSTLSITAGEVIRDHAEARTVVRPMGAADTDLESIWASVPAPDSEASVIVL